MASNTSFPSVGSAGGAPGDGAASGASGGPPPGGAPLGFVPLTPEQLAMLPHDNGATRVNAVMWSLTVLSGVFLMLRLYCKTLKGNRLWWDDWLLLASWVSGFEVFPLLAPLCPLLPASEVSLTKYPINRSWFWRRRA